MTTNGPTEEEVRRAVRERYSNLAKNSQYCFKTDSAFAKGTGAGDAFPRGLMYSREELDVLPPEVFEVSAGCGNPLSLAGLKPGDVVVDLGSGGGINVFLASTRVGPEGRVIGIDATPDIVWRARGVARDNDITNVEFRLGEIEHIPVESRTVDCVISNCVINLSPDKDSVFKEAFRILKPGGKLAVSDIVTLRELPPDVREDVGKWTRCISGAIPEQEYLEKLHNAGFVDVEITHRHVYDDKQASAIINDMGDSKCNCSDESMVGSDSEVPDIDYSDMIASDRITAIKPA